METTFDLDLGRVSPIGRASAWREWHDALYADRLVLPESHEEVVAGSMRGTLLGDGQLCRIVCAFSGVRLRPQAKSDPRITVWLQLSRCSRISIAGDISSLSAGDIIFLSSRDDIEVDIPAGGEVLLFHVPGDLVRSRLPVWNILRHKLSADLAGTSVLRSALINAHGVAPELNATQRSGVLLSLVELLAVPCSGLHDGEEASNATNHVHAALSHIREHFFDPALNAGVVAAARGLSRRRLDELFIRIVGTTVSAAIWHQRLEAARTMLGSASSVTGVAYSCGFSDSAHFSRLFKKRYGAGPSNWRGQESRQLLGPAP
ncbi:helix-turn-helix domain-containing protein [Noviherbaspirillum saxi]|uniref:AraC family transcriptional regulator n=1 Tax=Noviherbaspirillum saxi TaxID=2320863 RepID=A0A3A3FYS6_9BURK|nr:AraC family transcriptional regulator [Noviherbaspirillum saxi]